MYFFAVGLYAGLCAVLTFRFRNGIAFFLSLFLMSQLGFRGANVGHIRLLTLLCWSGFMVRYRGGSLASIAACRKSCAQL
jgi:hypothetical protein